MKKICYLLFVVLVSLLIGCNDPNEGNDYAVREGEPAGTWLEENGNFSAWVKLLRRANMFSILNVKTTFTCFVPTDQAVNEYLAGKGYQSVDDIPEAEVLHLVKYHILAGNEYQTKIMTNGRLGDTMVSGDYLISKFVGGDIYINDYARIMNRDIEVLNGYIHVLDKMLDPEIRSVWELLQSNPRYSIFTAAVEKAGLQPILHRTGRLHTGGKSFVTAMVVPDEVFKKAGMNGVDDVVREYSPEKDNYTEVSNPFYKYMAYHILSGMQSYNDLVDFEKGKNVKNIETLANNEMIMVEDVDNEVGYMCYVNGKQVDSVMDAEAVDIFWGYLDRNWYSDMSTDELFTNAFIMTAETIMTKSRTKTDVVFVLAAGFVIIGILFAAISAMKTKRRHERERAEETQRILNTPLPDDPLSSQGKTQTNNNIQL